MNIRLYIALAFVSVFIALFANNYGSITASAAGAATVTFSYDSNGRLVGNNASVGNSGTYAYDAANNRTYATIN